MRVCAIALTDWSAAQKHLDPISTLYVANVNHFGNKGGFDAFLERMRHEPPLGLLKILLHILNAVPLSASVPIALSGYGALIC